MEKGMSTDDIKVKTGHNPDAVGWESVVQQLNHILEPDKPSDGAADERIQRRVKYVLDRAGLNAIVCQKRAEGDVWLDEKCLSVRKFIFEDLPFMDETDRAVIDAISRTYFTKQGYSRQAVLNDILPHLAGSGRVFDISGTQIEIDSAGKPSLNVFNDAEGIVIGSDFSLGASGQMPNCMVKRLAPDRYSVITLNPMQRKILRMLLRTRSFPFSAAAGLKDFLDKVMDMFNVSENLEPLINKQYIDSDGKVAVIFSAYPGSQYGVRMEARPYDGCDIHFSPGSGAEECLHDNVIYHRDLAKEKERAENIVRKYRFLYKRSLDGTYFINSTAKMLNVLDFVHNHQDDYVIEWQGNMKISVGRMSFRDGNGLRLVSNESWFEPEGNFQVDDKTVTFKDLLRHSRDRVHGKYIKIDEQTYLRLTAKIQKQLDSLSMIVSPSGKIPKYYVGTLAKLLGTGDEKGGLQVGKDQGFLDLQEKMQQAYMMTPEVPDGLNAVLRPYQKEGFDWMVRLDAWGAGACLADDMGLGKTVQTIAFLLHKAQEGASLVIAPKSVVPNWQSELARFAPSLRCVVLNGMKDRRLVVDNAAAGDVVLATYGALSSNGEALAGKKWNVVCLDEAHYIKNRETKVSKAAMDLKAGSRVILTGTPVQNNLSEVWNLFQFLNPGILGPYPDFVMKYRDAPDALRTEHKKLIQPFILRRTKEEVLKDLPVKTCFDYIVPLTQDEYDGYEGLRNDIYEQISSEENRISAFAGLTKLKLAACSMSLGNPAWSAPSSKMMHLMNILDKLYGTGDNVLVFSQFTSFLNEVRTELEGRGMKYLYLDGQTSTAERKRLVSKFQDGNVPIFLISLKAGGLGLNLTAANYVILLDVWWNPAIESQAMDRAHRIGQSRDVTVIRMISGNTVEEKIVRLQDKKQSLSDDMMEGTADTAKLSYDEIIELLKK